LVCNSIVGICNVMWHYARFSDMAYVALGLGSISKNHVIYIYIYTYVFTFTYIYLHTHTHIYTPYVASQSVTHPLHGHHSVTYCYLNGK
jgi:hypothetical protein